jgi:sulfatase maturation enzyme AslB (radical SAM superfamily)
VNGVMDLVAELRPLHVSIVGGDPLVRYRELSVLLPKLIDRGIHVQLVTSAFRQLDPAWASLKNLNTVVSIDGLEADHNVRRAPATYERIVKNIAGHQITVHCTITAQMTDRPGYLEEFTAQWSARHEVKRLWFSIFTPQRGAVLPEILSQAQRQQVIRELLDLRLRFPKIDMPAGMIKEFGAPPSSPEVCIFARTTHIYSADLKTRVSPCQFGGDPDCSQCGCIASMGLSAIGNHRLGGLLPVGRIFDASFWVGEIFSRPQAPAAAPALRVLNDHKQV